MENKPRQKSAGSKLQRRPQISELSLFVLGFVIGPLFWVSQKTGRPQHRADREAKHE